MEQDSRFKKGTIVYSEHNVILASLPTSQDHVPESIQKYHGCINRADINFNCYLFENGHVVCSNGFSFPVETKNQSLNIL